jgi:hypothetical protein
VYGESRTRYVVGVVVVRNGPCMQVSREPSMRLLATNRVSSASSGLGLDKIQNRIGAWLTGSDVICAPASPGPSALGS